jgi:predicted transcriptional regulator
MSRSNLEIYLNILEAIERHGSLSITGIMYETNLNNKIGKGYIDFLTTNELVDVVNLNKKRSSYTLTPKGVLLLKIFKRLKSAFQLKEEELKPSLF